MSAIVIGLGLVGAIMIGTGLVLLGIAWGLR